MNVFRLSAAKGVYYTSARFTGHDVGPAVDFRKRRCTMEEIIKDNPMVDIADRLNEISADLKGVAEILFILREYEAAGSGGAERLLTLRNAVERHSQELSEIAKAI